MLLALLFSPDTVRAQGASAMSCYGSAGSPALVRAEGLSELVGDFIMSCTGGIPTGAGTAIPQTNIQIFLNTSVTSRIYGANASDALLLIDEPPPGSQLLCSSGSACPIVATGNGGAPSGGDYTGAGRYNVFQGQQVSEDSIAFQNIPIDPPGPNSTLVLRITNLRVNANRLSIGPSSSSTPVVGIVASLLPLGGATQNLAFVVAGLTPATVSKSNSTPQCASQNFVEAARVSVSEGFASAIKVSRAVADYYPSGAYLQSTPGANNYTESSFTLNPSGSAGNIGIADFGTRIALRFQNVPVGVNLFVPLQIRSTNSPSTLSASLIALESGGFSPLGPGPGSDGTIAAIPVSGGASPAVYEVTASDPSQIETISVPIYVSYLSNPGSNLPGLGAVTVAVTLDPVSTVTSADPSAPIPRFADTSVPTPAFSINPCGSFSVLPSSLPFMFESGNPPSSSTVAVSVVGGTSTQFSVAASSKPAGWLAVSSSTGALPANLTVTADPGNLAVGTYSGMIQITSMDGSLSATIPVAMSIRDVLVIPKTLSFAFTPGGPPPPQQTFSVLSRDVNPVCFRVSQTVVTPVGVNWPVISVSQSVTPATASLSINPTAVGLGTFLAYVTFIPLDCNNPAPARAATPAGVSAPSASQTIVIYLSSSVPGPFLFAFAPPGGLHFRSDNPAPQPVTYQMGPSPFQVITTTVDQPKWLNATAAGEHSPIVEVSAMPQSLVPNDDYLGHVNITDNMGSANGFVIRAHLSVLGDTPLLSVDPNSLTLLPPASESATPSAAVNVTSSGSSTLIYKASVLGADWLLAVPRSGKTPDVLDISLAHMPSEDADGYVAIQSDAAANPEQTVHVSFIARSAGSQTQIFPHIASEPEWQTEIFILNTSNAPVIFSLVFHTDSGAVLPLEGGPVTRNVTLQPHGTAFFRTAIATGSSSGWAELFSSAALSGVALFRRHAAVDGKYYEGAVPLGLPYYSFAVPFDETQFHPGMPFLDGIAITNTDPNQPAQISCTAYDSNGEVLIQNLQIGPLSPSKHTSFLIDNQFGPSISNHRGTLVCQSTTLVAAVEIRTTASLPAVSSMPVITDAAIVRQ